MKAFRLLLALALVAAAVSLPAAEVLRITFDGAPLGTAPVPYPGYAGDTLGGATVNTSDPTGPGDPDLASAGTVVATPALSGSPQGGQCLQVNGANGYYVALPTGLASYTVEIVVAFTTYPGGSAEFGLTNVLSTAPGGGSNTETWELRGMGIFGSPANEFVLMSDNDTAAPGDVNNELGNFVPVTNQWYNMAVSYDSGTDTLKGFIAGVGTFSYTPGFGAGTLDDFTFGYWPNDANSNRDVVGYIDAVRVSDSPDDFGTLPAELSVLVAD